jgi:predicted ribosomally synthesized peptide with nif11-like leader
MNENIKKFVEKAINDKALQDKMAACKTPEEAYAIASSVQDGFTMEEFTEAMQQLFDLTHENELTDEDLAKAAGGTSEEDDFTIFLTMSGIAVSASAALSVVEAASAAAGCAV